MSLHGNTGRFSSGLRPGGAERGTEPQFLPAAGNVPPSPPRVTQLWEQMGPWGSRWQSRGSQGNVLHPGSRP